MIHFSYDSPQIGRFPDRYGHDWDAYEAADAKYQREAKKVRAQILEEIFTCMKKGEQVTFEIRGKMKNIVVSVPKSDVDNAIEVWDIYKQM
jgi:DNA-binding protein YbaB